MKELIRLETTTPKGRIFLSPFVFEKGEAERRKKAYEKESADKVRLIKTSEYPSEAVWSIKEYGKDEMNINSLLEHVDMLDKKWEAMEDADNREDTQEVEERGTDTPRCTEAGSR